MNKVSNKILLAMIAASLAACGGGDDGGGGGDDGQRNVTGTPVEGKVKASNNAVFNLSGVVTLMEYDEVVDQEAVSTQTFELSGLTSTVSTASSDVFTTLGASNLLGINKNGDTVFPVANVEPLMVDYSLLSPDQKKLYIAVSNSQNYDYSGLARNIYLENTDDPNFGGQPIQPLIGPALESDVPLTWEQLADGWAEPETVDANADGSCPEGVKSSNSECVTGILVYASESEDPTRIKVQDVLNTLEQDYFSCSLIELDRQGGPMDCVGGTTVAEARVNIVGYQFPFKLKTAKFNRGDSYYSSYNLDSFENIRPGLRPLQFDDAGNLYTLTSRFNSDFGYYSGTELTRITPTGELEQVIGLDSVDVRTFLTLSNGDIVTSVNNYNNSGASGISLIQNGSMISVSSDYWEFQADTGSTFIINGKLFKALADGNGFTSVPIKYKEQSIRNIHLTDEGELYGCHTNQSGLYDIVRVYPYKDQAVVPGESGVYGCNFSSISFGYRVAIEEVKIGTLGTTEIISILRLADGQEYEVFSEADYSDKPRYNITNLAFGGNKIIFSADRTTSPIGTVLGEIDVSLMGQGKPVEEYMKLNDVQSSVAASNTVRKITPLPTIEPTTTASAPRILDPVYFDPAENSHVGFEFSEFMDKDTVIDSLTVTNTTDNNSVVEYVPFWGYKKLYLIADTNGLGDSNGDNVIDDKDYQPFIDTETYNVNFNIFMAKDVSGRTMSTSENPNADHDFTF